MTLPVPKLPAAAHTAELALLRAELKHSEVRLPEAWEQDDRILAHIWRAVNPPVHEGRLSPYGAIVSNTSFPADFGKVLSVENRDVLVSAADGRNTFVLLKGDGTENLAVSAAYRGGEQELARLAATTESLIIQRDRVGIVRLFLADGVYTNEGRRWWYKQGIGTLSRRIRRHVPQAPSGTLEHLLEFALYVLSPLRCGATLVWSLNAGVRDKLLDGPFVDLRSLQLSATLPADLVTASHILSQHDGATLVSSAGELVATGIHLQASSKSRELINEHGGTRHTSARRFSFDEAASLLITVSADGPVTVFSDGAQVGHVKLYS